jgi:hypothetical protein
MTGILSRRWERDKEICEAPSHGYSRVSYSRGLRLSEPPAQIARVLARSHSINTRVESIRALHNCRATAPAQVALVLASVALDQYPG